MSEITFTNDDVIVHRGAMSDEKDLESLEEQREWLKIRKPGSRKAVESGCTCPILDNGHGRGVFGNPGAYWMTEGCPVHTETVEESKLDQEINDIIKWVNKQPEEE